MNRCMIDLETLGTTPGSVILSIGGVFFDEKEETLGQVFYRIVDTNSCLEAGLTIDENTAKWWSEQAPEAQEVCHQAANGFGKPLGDVLKDFVKYSNDNCPTGKLEIWGNGAGFDEPILAAAWRAMNWVEPAIPWAYNKSLCYRTLRKLFPRVQLPEWEGVRHNALDDAIYQAKCAMRLLRVSGAFDRALSYAGEQKS